MTHDPFTISRRIKSGTFAVILIAIFLLSPLSTNGDLFGYDLLFWLRGAQPPPSDVIIVAIDEESFQEIGVPWPWPRAVHAQLIKSLYQAGATAVAFDVVFAGASDESNDESLRAEISAHNSVVLASDYDTISDPRFEREVLVSPYPGLLSDSTLTGYVNYPIDPDAFLRRIKIRDSSLNPLAKEAAKAFAADRVASNRDLKELFINFYGPTRTIKTVSYYQALNPDHYLPSNIFRNKLVFVGLSLSSSPKGGLNTKDHYPTPFARFGELPTAGVELHATVAANYLTNGFISGLSGTNQFLSFLAATVVFLLLFSLATPLLGSSALILTIAMLTIASSVAFSRHNFFFPFPTIIGIGFISYFTSLFAHYLSMRAERNYIRGAFTNYVSKDVVAELLRHPERLELGGKQVNATVMFLDLAGFTTFSEQLTPEELIQLLNRNLGSLSDLILTSGAFVDKYIGDSIMAGWGIPLAYSDHAIAGCKVGLSLIQKVNILAVEEKRISGVDLSVRIGINSGAMVVGNIGGKHVNYTALGNAVNLASRLEGVNRVYGTKILIGEQTASELEDKFLIRCVDRVRVKGQATPVNIFELGSESLHSDPALAAAFAQFSKAREHFQKREWKNAIALFSEVLKAFPNDGPSQTLQRRAEQFFQLPPSPEWDGVFDLETK